MPEEKAAQPAPPKEPEIHVIPDEFYGAAGKAKLPKAAAKPVQPAIAPPAAGSSAPITPPPTKRGGKKWLLIPIAALAFLVLLGVGTWLLLSPAAQERPDQGPGTAVQRPPVQPPPPAPEPEEEEPTEEEEVPPPPEPVEEEPEPENEGPANEPPSIADDEDNDGLSGSEEDLYGTDPGSADSDEDGFSDSVEVVNLYNPAGFTPTRLLEAGLVARYAPQGAGYEIFYPTSWTVSEQAGGEVVFRNPENEPVSVTIEENPDRQAVLDWYLSRNPGVSPVDVQQFFTKSGLEGVRSPNGLTAYIDGGERVFIVAYTPGLAQTVRFRATFTMMVNSFLLAP